MYNNTSAVLSEDRRRHLLEKTLEYRFNWINDQLQQPVVSIQKEDALSILQSLDEARRAKDCSLATTQPESPLEAEVAEIVPKTSSDLSAVKRMHLPFPKARLLLDRLEACQSLLRGEIAELGCRDNHSLQGPVSETVKQIIREGFDDLISKDGILQDEKIAPQVQQISVANNVVTKAEPTDSIASSLSDNNNNINNAHSTESANNAFLSRLKDPRAATIVELLRSFIRSFLELDMAKLYSTIPDPDALDSDSEETTNSAETSRRENQPSQRRSMKNLPASGP